jgi:hypothetical protein
MRIAAVELHVEVSRRGRARGEVSDGDAILRALASRADARSALALEAIEIAASLEPAIVVVLNPAHAPSGSYVRDKRRAGPWRAIVSTANGLDRARLGRSPLAPPAHAVAAGQDLAPAVEPIAVGERGSRVVVYDVG